MADRILHYVSIAVAIAFAALAVAYGTDAAGVTDAVPTPTDINMTVAYLVGAIFLLQDVRRHHHDRMGWY